MTAQERMKGLEDENDGLRTKTDNQDVTIGQLRVKITQLEKDLAKYKKVSFVHMDLDQHSKE